jgi:ubiquitin carboxyl-terminal hydrolase 5/13
VHEAIHYLTWRRAINHDCVLLHTTNDHFCLESLRNTNLCDCRYVGLKNLGNSCYINSVLQLIWSMPEVYTPYIQRAEDIFRTSPKSADDFILQVSHCESPWSAGKECTTCPLTICQNSHCLRLFLDMIYPSPVFFAQFTKVGMALSSDTQGCSRENNSDQRSISPWMFKRICGQRHHEFSTSNQQVFYVWKVHL